MQTVIIIALIILLVSVCISAYEEVSRLQVEVQHWVDSYIKMLHSNGDYFHKLSKIENIVRQELEYPTPWTPEQVEFFKQSILEQEKSGNITPYHPLQIMVQSAVAETKKSLLKQMNEILFKKG